MGTRLRGAHDERRAKIRRDIQKRHATFYQSHPELAARGVDFQASSRRRKRLLIAGAALGIMSVSAVAVSGWLMQRPVPLPTADSTVEVELPNAGKLAGHTTSKPMHDGWTQVVVKPGQTLSDIFADHELGAAAVAKVIDASKHDDKLSNLYPGDTFSIRKAADGSLAGFRFDLSPVKQVTLGFAGDKPISHVLERHLERREHVARGIVEGSLTASVEKAGLSASLAADLVHVLKNEKGFADNVRKGSHFTVVYDNVYVDGSYLHSGNILAAELESDGARLTAYRFKRPGGEVGYYTVDGVPLEKPTLITPVNYKRISSPFSRARKNPVLGYVRPHDGVDLAAPSGTPIRAAGDGVIEVRGWESGYGRIVVIKHNRDLSTAYAHMSRFAKGERKGSHVKQGQIIGYVGSTGIATGPHLHYEVRIDGTPVPPLSHTHAKPQRLPSTVLASFRRHTAPWLALIERIDTNMRLASAVSGNDNGEQRG